MPIGVKMKFEELMEEKTKIWELAKENVRKCAELYDELVLDSTKTDSDIYVALKEYWESLKTPTLKDFKIYQHLYIFNNSLINDFTRSIEPDKSITSQSFKNGQYKVLTFESSKSLKNYIRNHTKIQCYSVSFHYIK
jgi:hypothetical protein